MRGLEKFVGGVVALGLAATLAAPVGATTLRRAGLDELVAGNGTIVVGQVLDVESRWNADHTFILTDVKVAVSEKVKGRVQGETLTVTLMGGRVGETTTLILGGAELIPGNEYLLFLNREELPGEANALTVRDHVQGAFNLIENKGDGKVQAFSQALHTPLVPDASGNVRPVGGEEGLPLADMLVAIREIAKQQGPRQEVK